MTTSITVHNFNQPGVRYYNVYIHDKKIMTTLTSNANHVSDWIREIVFDNQPNRLRLIVGLDIKFAPGRRRPVALLLLFSYRSCLIFQLAHATEIPCVLPHFLSNNNHTFVGIGNIETKLLRMRREYGTGGRAWNHDLAALAAVKLRRPELRGAGLTQLRTFFYGSDVERPAVVGNWDEEQLSNEHVHRASLDAYTCYELGSYLVTPVKIGTPD